MLKDVHWLGHAAVKITADKVVYVDPYEIKAGAPADLILVTHDHFDHLSVEDIYKIEAEHTVVVLPASSNKNVEAQVKRVAPGEKLTVAGIPIEVVAAYNIDKDFHPREQQHVGYVFTVGGVTYYHAGDTDLIPQMSSIDADVAFLPVGGTYTMDAAQAARAAEAIGPKIAVPIHWGKIVGSADDARAFQQACDCPVEILTPEE